MYILNSYFYCSDLYCLSIDGESLRIKDVITSDCSTVIALYVTIKHLKFIKWQELWHDLL